MKRYAFFLIALLLLSCKSSEEVKKQKAAEKLAEYRNKDIQWKDYVNKLEEDAKANRDIAKYAQLWTRFESFAPFCGHYDNIKDKISSKYQIKNYKEIKIPTHDGLKLDGWFIPVENAKATAIVLHGWGSDMEFGLSQSRFLLDLGYQLILFNARFWNYWENPYEYVGDFSKDITDIEDVTKFAETLKGVDKNKLGVIGFSKGARKAIVAGGMYPQLKFVIADAAPTDAGYDNTEEEIALEKEVDQYIAEHFGQTADTAQFDPINQIDKISPRPVLLLHGEKDTSVPIKCSQLLFDKALEPKAFKTFPKSGHCLGMLTSDKADYIAAVGEFLNGTIE